MNEAEEVSSLTSLMAAAQCGHVNIVAKLIKAGSNVNAVCKVRISLLPVVGSKPILSRATGWVSNL